MEKLSELLGRPVVNIYEAKVEGYINNVLCDKNLNKIKYILFFDDESQEEKLISAKNIYFIGKDAVTIKNGDNVLLESDLIKDDINPINFDIFTVNGDFVSKICDATLIEKIKIQNLELQNGETLTPNMILSAGKNVAIKNEDTKLKLNHFRSNKKLLSDKFENVLVEIQTPPLLVNAGPLPKKLVASNYDYLLGRKVDKNIYSDNKVLIIRKQSQITEQIIEIAKKFGKLKELTANSIE